LLLSRWLLTGHPRAWPGWPGHGSERYVHARLVVVDGETKARQFELELPAVIGRSRATDVTLGNPLVSRRHCEVFESEGSLMLRDLGSLNGTFVGEARLAEQPMLIEPGQKFTVGPVTFQAEYQALGDPSQAEQSEAGGQTIDAPLDFGDED
jgi:predicted component of type VI protein secretion system